MYFTACGFSAPDLAPRGVSYTSYPTDAPGILEDGYHDWWLEQQATGLALGTGPCSHADSALSDLIAYKPVEGFEGLYLRASASHYRYHAEAPVDPDLGNALASVSRAMLAESSSAPQLSSFPDSFRDNGNTEMMVLLRQAEQPRLWRSARGRSRAQALLTATRFARSRWIEREEAMGGPLRRALDRMSVDVLELRAAGVIDMSDPRLLSQAVGSAFGLGFARGGRWRYVLPYDIAQAGGPEAALVTLLEANGLSLDAARRSDIRVYRYLPKLLGTSSPAP